MQESRPRISLFRSDLSWVTVVDWVTDCNIPADQLPHQLDVNATHSHYWLVRSRPECQCPIAAVLSFFFIGKLIIFFRRDLFAGIKVINYAFRPSWIHLAREKLKVFIFQKLSVCIHCAPVIINGRSIKNESSEFCLADIVILHQNPCFLPFAFFTLMPPHQ